MARAPVSRVYDELYDFLITSAEEHDEQTVPIVEMLTIVEMLITRGEAGRGTPVRKDVTADRKRRAVEQAHYALVDALEYDDDLLQEIVFIILKA